MSCLAFVDNYLARLDVVWLIPLSTLKPIFGLMDCILSNILSRCSVLRIKVVVLSKFTILFNVPGRYHLDSAHTVLVSFQWNGSCNLPVLMFCYLDVDNIDFRRIGAVVLRRDTASLRNVARSRLPFFAKLTGDVFAAIVKKDFAMRFDLPPLRPFLLSV